MFKPASGYYGTLDEPLDMDSTVMMVDANLTNKLSTLLAGGHHTYLYIGTRYYGEVVRALSVANGTVSIVRAQDGSRALTFLAQAQVRYTFCAAAVTDMLAGYVGGIQSVTGAGGIVVTTVNGIAQVSMGTVNITSPNNSITVAGTFPNMSLTVNPRSFGLCTLGIAASEGVGSPLVPGVIESPDDGGGGGGGGGGDDYIIEVGAVPVGSPSYFSATQGQELRGTVEIPSGVSQLVISTSGGTGDVDLLIRYGLAATSAERDADSQTGGNVESCTVPNPTAGTWHFTLVAFEAFSDVALLVEYT